MNKELSLLLDELQKEKEQTNDEYKLKILNRFIALLERHIK